MGRLSALRLRLAGALVAALALTACDKDAGSIAPPPPASGRSNAVLARGGASAAAPTAHPTAAPSAPAAPRQLCVGQRERPAPKGNIKIAAASGATPPFTPVPFGVGKWVWVNFWAAWCGPCKEEMPRLLAWKERLAGAGVLLDLAFVSLDDDARQLQRFLETQPPSGVRASYWLPDGDLRSGWLAALGLKNPPDLPVQALVSPTGQVSCIIQGAVEDRDYAAIAAVMGAKAR